MIRPPMVPSLVKPHRGTAFWIVLSENALRHRPELDIAGEQPWGAPRAADHSAAPGMRSTGGSNEARHRWRAAHRVRGRAPLLADSSC